MSGSDRAVSLHDDVDDGRIADALRPGFLGRGHIDTYALDWTAALSRTVRLRLDLTRTKGRRGRTPVGPREIEARGRAHAVAKGHALGRHSSLSEKEECVSL